MKSYLGLVFEYAKIHHIKNRLTILCIAISVMLVTAIFGMADISIKAQMKEIIRQYGNFHAIINNISDEIANQIGSHNGVKVASWVGIAEDITYQDNTLILQSSTEAMAQEMNLYVTEGSFPLTEQEAIIDEQALEKLNLSIGDTIEIMLNNYQLRPYTITGTYNDFSTLLSTNSHGLFLSVDGMRALPKELYREYFFVQFENNININQTVSEIKAEYHLTDEQVSLNNILLGLMGQSTDSTMVQVYVTAIVLFLLVTAAGTFMIASSFSMNLSERTQFFGLLRCLGATKKQIKHYIQLEGLLYCVKGIPIGLFAGSILLWCSVFILNSLNSQYIPQMPLFQISWPSIASGVTIGFLVVMIASSSPAKQAAKVSPQAAVTGNMSQGNPTIIKKATNTKLFHIDTALGLHHAFSNKKNLLLISGSFTLSIVLFVCFTVLITFMNHALKPMKPYAPDLSVVGIQDTTRIEPWLKEKIKALPHVDTVYGRMFHTNLTATTDNKNIKQTILLSYDEPQINWAKKLVVSGSIEDINKQNHIFVDYNQAAENHWNVGDTVILKIQNQEIPLQIAAILSDIPFDGEHGEWMVVSSEQTFVDITGTSDYTILDIKIKKDVSRQIKGLLPADLQLLDFQLKNGEIRNSYYAMAVFIYGFLIVIALVALINIINTINASVASRMKNYGMMRAIGMSGNQLKKIVYAETITYALTGSMAGCVIGLLLHRFFFSILITSNWGQPWQPPVLALSITILTTIFTSFVAILTPIKKINNMSIIAIVNAR